MDNKETKIEQIQFRMVNLDRPCLNWNDDVLSYNKQYYNYGEENNFGDELVRLSEESSIFNAILKTYCDYVGGNGLKFNDLKYENETLNKDYETLDDIVKKAIKDYVTFGGCAIQVIRDKLTGSVTALYNLDFNNCRVSSDKKHILYTNKWRRYNSKVLSLPLFERGYVHANSIFYYKNPMTQRDKVYPSPMYIGALKDIIIDAKISDYFLNSIDNDFSGNMLVNFNDGRRDEETQRRIVESIRENFCGSKNASKLMCMFNDNKENATTIERIEDSQWDKKFENLAKTIRQNIFVAFRITPNLCGLNTENNGFNSEEYESSFRLFNKTCIEPIQRQIERAFSILLGNQVFEIEPFKIDFNNETNTNNDNESITNQ